MAIDVWILPPKSVCWSQGRDSHGRMHPAWVAGCGRHFLQFTVSRICVLVGPHGVIFTSWGHYHGPSEIVSCVYSLWGPESYTSLISQCRVLHFSIKTPYILFILNPSYWHLLRRAKWSPQLERGGWGRGGSVLTASYRHLRNLISLSRESSLAWSSTLTL